MTQQDADQTVARLSEAGVKMVACTFVDNAGVTRVKSVPLDKLAGASQNGIGISSLFSVFGIDDHITAIPGYDGPSGDMRLIPDLEAVKVLWPKSGWAWAPVWMYDQQLQVMPICPRDFTGKMVAAAEAKGISFNMTYEVEFTLTDPEGQPKGEGLSGYGVPKLIEVEDFLLEMADALQNQGVSVAQVHPEYSLGQYEISLGPRSPVEAADQQVLVRQTILRVAKSFGYKVSFSPVVIPGEVANGCHLHFSAWQDGKNLFTGGQGPEELTTRGESMAAGVLSRLSEMSALLAPSVISFERLKPSTWSGAFACWGWENREAALRLCKGTKSIRHRAANFELKCIDGTVNPYLVVGAIVGCCLDGLEQKLKLPAAIQIDPAILSQDDRQAMGCKLVAADLAEAIGSMENSTFLRELLGDSLYQSYLAVRKLDHENYKDKPLEELVRMLRWRYC